MERSATSKAPAYSKSRAMERLLDARMDMARLLATTYDTQRELHQVIGITGELYEAIAGEEAPEIAFVPKVWAAS